MNPYAALGSLAVSPAALSLCERLSTWHDAMVAHERRLRGARPGAACHDECPHAEAQALWFEARELFGARADELRFLRSRGDVERGS